MKQKTYWNFLLLLGYHPVFHSDQLMQLFLVVDLPCTRLLSLSEVRSESIWTFRRTKFVAESQGNDFFKMFRISCFEQRQVIWISEDSKVKYLLNKKELLQKAKICRSRGKYVISIESYWEETVKSTLSSPDFKIKSSKCHQNTGLVFL